MESTVSVDALIPAQAAPDPSPLPVRGLGARYGMAVLCLGIALGGRALLTPVWGMKFPFIVLYPAVLVSTWPPSLGTCSDSLTAIRGSLSKLA